MNLCIYAVAGFCTLYFYTRSVKIMNHLVLFLYNAFTEHVCASLGYSLDDGRVVCNRPIT